MRLDLFLKSSRLVKRRAVAREMCSQGRVLVNAREAKPAKDVKPGDFMTLEFSTRTIELEILSASVPTKKASIEHLYKVVSETMLPREKDIWSEHLSSP